MAESSGDEYKQPSSSAAESEDDQESAPDEETSQQSKSVASDGENEQQESSSDIEAPALDDSYHLTQPDDTISRISDSVEDPEETLQADNNESSPDEQDPTDQNKKCEDDPDKTLDYNPSDQSRSMDDSVDTSLSKDVKKSDKTSVSKTSPDVLDSNNDDSISTVSESTPQRSNRKGTIRHGKVSKKSTPKKGPKLIVKITTPVKKVQRSEVSTPVISPKVMPTKKTKKSVGKEGVPTTTQTSTAKLVKDSHVDAKKSKSPPKKISKLSEMKKTTKDSVNNTQDTSAVKQPTDSSKSAQKKKNSDFVAVQNSPQTTRTAKKIGDVEYADIEVVPFVDDFGDTSKPKKKSSSKLPSKSSKRKQLKPDVIPPTPPRPPKVGSQKDTSSKDSQNTDVEKGKQTTQKKKHKSSDAALKTLSAFRKTIGSIITPPTTGTSEPPKKKQRVQKFSADYDDGGGAGPSNASPTSSRNKSVADNPSPNVNPLVAPKKNNKNKKSSAQKPTNVTGKVTPTIELEQQKVQVLKELSKKYGTGQSPIIIAPQMMSPTPSTETLVARSVDGEEDELTMWGKLIVKKLRKFKDKQKMEDVQNYIHVLITDAERGHWSKPSSLMATPRQQQIPPTVVHLDATPDRAHMVTHTIRSPMPRPGNAERLVRSQNIRPTNVNQPHVGVSSHEVNRPTENTSSVGNRPRPNLPTPLPNLQMETSGVVGEHLRLLNQQPDEFTYTWQGPSGPAGQASHPPQIFLNYPQYARERDEREETDQNVVQCSQRNFTSM